MLKRTWHFATPNGDHTILLRYNSITGRMRVFLDNELVREHRDPFGQFLRQSGTVDDVEYELNCIFASVGSAHYLYVDNKYIPVDGKHFEKKLSGQLAEKLLLMKNLLQRVVNETDLQLISHPTNPTWWQHRLLGTIDGYLSMVAYVPPTQGVKEPAVCMVIVRHLPVTQVEDIKQAVLANEVTKKLRGHLITSPHTVMFELDATGIMLPVDMYDESDLLNKLHSLINVLHKYIQPINVDMCEDTECPLPDAEQISLVMDHGKPMMLCSHCIDKRRIEHEENKTQSKKMTGRDWLFHLATMLLVGAGYALLSLVDNVIVGMSITVLPTLSILLMLRLQIAITVPNLAANATLGSLGYVGGMFLASLLNVAMQAQISDSFGTLLQLAWKAFISSEPDPLRMFLIYIMVCITGFGLTAGVAYAQYVIRKRSIKESALEVIDINL